MSHAVVLFDGVCNLCNASVRFVIRHDPEGHFRFSPLQSEFAQKKLEQLGLQPGYEESMLLIAHERMSRKSTAVLKIAKKLNGIWPAFYVLMAIPAPVRDFVYDIIARHRYGLFGRKEKCMIPTPDLQSRFIN
jgi:predicted DCC family thiol-disulfide oxidoreductase YuxK